MMKPICIIPARGGSKRLPRKNILDVYGTTMIGRAVLLAKSSGVFREVVVSSDDGEILAEAQKYGARVFKRDSKLATDDASVVDVCLDLLTNETVSHFCCLYATSVLLRPETLSDSYHRFIKIEDLQAVLMGVSRYNYHPLKALHVDETGIANAMFKEFSKYKSQELPNCVVSNGSFYWATREGFLMNKTFYTDFLHTYLLPNNEVSDVDTQADYENLLRRFGKYE